MANPISSSGHLGPPAYTSTPEFRCCHDGVFQSLLYQGRNVAQANEDMAAAINKVVKSIYSTRRPAISPELVGSKTVYGMAWRNIYIEYSTWAPRQKLDFH